MLRKHRLGRKRLLDTYLVATLLDNGVEGLITCDTRDFARLPQLEIINPLTAR